MLHNNYYVLQYFLKKIKKPTLTTNKIARYKCFGHYPIRERAIKNHPTANEKARHKWLKIFPPKSEACLPIFTWKFEVVEVSPFSSY